MWLQWIVTGVAVVLLASGANGQGARVEMWRQLNDAGVLAYKKGRLAEAEESLREALTAAQNIGPRDWRVVTSLNHLVRVYDRQGKHAQAEPLCQRSLKIYDEATTSSQPKMARSLLELADHASSHAAHAFAHGAPPDEVLPLFQRALTIKERVLGETHHDVSECLSRLARVFQMQGKYSQAESLSQRALVIVEDAVSAHRLPEYPSLVLRLTSLSQLHLAQGQYKKAEPLLERALQTVERAQGDEHPSAAGILHKLAKLDTDQGNYTQAKSRYRQALAIYQKSFGHEDPHVAGALHALGVCHLKQRQYAEAESFFKRALAIKEKALGPEDPSVAETLESYSTLLLETDRPAQAARLQAQAKSIRELPIGLD